jgi:hypothetical protein
VHVFFEFPTQPDGGEPAALPEPKQTGNVVPFKPKRAT